MPTIQEIAQKRGGVVAIRHNSSNLKTSLKVIFLLSLVVFVCVYFMPAKIVSIPDNIYITSNKGYFKELFETPYKKVIWFGADCPVSVRKKEIINVLMKETKLDQYYVHKPFFLQSFHDVKISDTMEGFIMRNCPSGYCIVDPTLRKIVRTDDKHLIRDMLKYLDNTNW